MQRKIMAIGTVVIVLVLLSAGATSLARPTAQQGGAPPVVSYQGHVLVKRLPFTGIGYFKFSVVNTTGNQTYWSNDGSASAGGEPTGAVALPVNGGLFEVLLGDTSVGGMNQPLSAEVFAEPDRYLRVWFSADGSVFTQLSPDRQVAAVPYALQAAAAQEADLLDGKHGNEYANTSHTHLGSDITTAVATATWALQAQNALTASHALDADMLDGKHGSEYANVSHAHLGSDITTAVATATWALQAQNALTTNYALDADMLDGQHGDEFANVSHTHLGSDITTAVATATLALQAREAFTASYALDADTLDGLHGSAYQLHLNALCSPGQSARGFLDGALVCGANEPLDPSLIPTATLTTTLAGSGGYIHVTTGADGLPFITYQSPVRDLMAIHCENLECTATTISNLDSTGEVGSYPSVMVGADGLPLISYFDYTNGNLKAAHCQNMTCTTATIRTVDNSADNVGWESSVTLGADGLPFISYYDHTNGNLKVAHCHDSGCAATTITTLDSVGDVGEYTAVALGVDGLPVIAYGDDTQDLTKVAHCQNRECTSADFAIVDTQGNPSGTSLAIGVDGLPLIAYYDVVNLNAKVAHCQDVACTTSSVTVLDDAGGLGWYPSMMVGSDELPLVAYYDSDQSSIIAAHCQNVACTAVTTSAVNVHNGGAYIAATRGSDGFPFIASSDALVTIRTAHCSNTFCVPYFRRR